MIWRLGCDEQCGSSGDEQNRVFTRYACRFLREKKNLASMGEVF